ncbi:MAG: hypothetical protein ACSLFH_13650, partial [Desulfuromonadales bacterium]
PCNGASIRGFVPSFHGSVRKLSEMAEMERLAGMVISSYSKVFSAPVLGACRTWEIQAKIRLDEGRFCRFLRLIVVLLTKKAAKYNPFRRICSGFIPSPTDSWVL